MRVPDEAPFTALHSQLSIHRSLFTAHSPLGIMSFMRVPDEVHSAFRLSFALAQPRHLALVARLPHSLPRRRQIAAPHLRFEFCIQPMEPPLAPAWHMAHTTHWCVRVCVEACERGPPPPRARLSTPAWPRVSPPSNARSRREAATTTASASATSSTPAPATSPAGAEQGGVAGGEHTRLHETARDCARVGGATG